MNRIAVGLIAGLLVAVASVGGGLTGFLLAIVLGGVGLAVGAFLEGRLDLGVLRGGRRHG